MESSLAIIKGIHPGLILDRELKKQKFTKVKFAMEINEFPQTLGAIMKGKRRMNPSLSLKIEKALGWEEGYLMILQAYFDIEQEKKKQAGNNHPDLSKIRSIIFWDTEFATIDWLKSKVAIVTRIFERGNEQEIQEIIRFYGKEVVSTSLENTQRLLPSAIENKRRFIMAN